jgi:phage I-like protein
MSLTILTPRERALARQLGISESDAAKGKDLGVRERITERIAAAKAPETGLTESERDLGKQLGVSEESLLRAKQGGRPK